MTHKPTSKTSRIDTRLTLEERKLIELMAEKEGIGVSEYLRNVVLAIAESAIENKELNNAIPGMKKENAIEMLKALINEDKDTTLNSIKGVHESLIDKLDRLEKLISVFIYVYLYHTPEVLDGKKKQAKESAVVRVKKTLTLIDDKQMRETLSERDGV